MKPLVKATIPYSEVVAMADAMLAKPPEFFEPFLGKKNPSFDEISAFVNAQIKERMEDEVWANDSGGAPSGQMGRGTRLAPDDSSIDQMH